VVFLGFKASAEFVPKFLAALHDSTADVLILTSKFHPKRSPSLTPIFQQMLPVEGTKIPIECSNTQLNYSPLPHFSPLYFHFLKPRLHFKSSLKKTSGHCLKAFRIDNFSLSPPSVRYSVCRCSPSIFSPLYLLRLQRVNEHQLVPKYYLNLTDTH
jgi:hypothetical protein